jgi:hypothetical protein
MIFSSFCSVFRSMLWSGDDSPSSSGFLSRSLYRGSQSNAYKNVRVACEISMCDHLGACVER